MAEPSTGEIIDYEAPAGSAQVDVRLEREATVARNATVQQEGGQEVVREIEFLYPVAASGSAARASSLAKPRTIRSQLS